MQEIFRGRLGRRLARGRLLDAARHDQAQQAAVEPVFDVDQRRGDIDEHGIGCRGAFRDDVLEPGKFLLDVAAQLAEAEHAERVADLAQQLDLRAELCRLATATAYENIQRVLDLAEILADRRGNRLHQLDAGRRQRIALFLDRLIDRQQLVEAERAPHRRDPRALTVRARDVIQEIVQQLDRRSLRIARLTILVEPLELAIREPEKTLDGYAALETVLAQRFDDGTDDPPQLEHRLLRRDLLHLLRDTRERAEILVLALAAYPAHEAKLELGAEAARRQRDIRRSFRQFAARVWRRFAVRLQVQQQQRAFRQQRTATHGTQIVQQRQQDQREVAAAGQHPIEIARQLHHRAQQRVEALRVRLLLGGAGDHVAGDLLHLLGEQRGAVDLEHAQHALHAMQFGGRTLEQ